MKTKQTYNRYQLAYAVLMALALLWLTVSAPFVFSHQQKVVQQGKMVKLTNLNAGTEEEASAPLGNNNEEKVPDTNSFSEEYLHDHDKADPLYAAISTFRTCEKAGTYIAFHGEILVPPPNHA